MKALLAVVLMIAATTSQAADCSGDGMLCRDKALHFGGSAAMAAAVTMATKNERVGFWSTVAVGVAKEVWDDRNRARGHQPSAKDLLADVAGAYVGTKAGTALIIRRNSVAIVIRL